MAFLAKTISLTDFELKEEGYMFSLYEHRSDDSLSLKLYGKEIHPSVIYEEYSRAQFLTALGIKIRKIFEVVRTEDGILGLLTERVQDPRSLNSFIQSDPIEAAHLMMEELDLLHRIKGEGEEISDITEEYQKGLSEIYFLDEKTKNKITDFLKDNKKDNFIHGNLHTGALYLSSQINYWVNFGKFYRGNPLFDFGNLYFICKMMPEEVLLGNFGLTKNQAEAFYGEISKKISDSLVEPYAALKLITIAVHSGFEPWMDEAIENMLLKNI